MHPGGHPLNLLISKAEAKPLRAGIHSQEMLQSRLLLEQQAQHGNQLPEDERQAGRDLWGTRCRPMGQGEGTKHSGKEGF